MDGFIEDELTVLSATFVLSAGTGGGQNDRSAPMGPPSLATFVGRTSMNLSYQSRNISSMS